MAVETVRCLAILAALGACTGRSETPSKGGTGGSGADGGSGANVGNAGRAGNFGGGTGGSAGALAGRGGVAGSTGGVAGSPAGAAGTAGGTLGEAGADGSGGTAGSATSGGAAGSGGSAGGGGSAGAVNERLACVDQMLLGYRHACALTRDGALFCWLGNEHGQLGDGSQVPSMVPLRVSLIGEVTSGAADYESTYAILADSSAYRWGRISYSASQETLLAPTAISFAPDARSFHLGAAHSCLLDGDSRVACWGANQNGQLGDGTTDYRLSPAEPTALGPVAAFAVGYGHACAAKSDGSLWCWGDNYRGQLGLGTHDDALVPTEVTSIGAGVTQVATRHEFTCALLEDASVSCWGRFSWNDTVGDPTPRVRPELADVTEIAAGSFHACALKADASLWCWASPVPDALPGIGATVPEPFEAVGTDVTKVWAGYSDTCIRKRDETVWCWGARLGGTPTQIAEGCEEP
jgi:hypothetical protein